MLLSYQTCIALNILPKNYPNPITTSIKSIMKSLSSGPSGPLDWKAVRRDLLVEFAAVFEYDGKLHIMIGEPMKIELKDDSVPFAVNGPRPIPYAQNDEVKKCWMKWRALESFKRWWSRRSGCILSSSFLNPEAGYASVST